MEDKKEKLTKEELIEKINNERITFRNALEKKDEECRQTCSAVRRVADMVMARVVRSFGTPRGDDGEIVLDIPKPDTPEGKIWAVKAEELDAETYRLHAKLIDIEL